MLLKLELAKIRSGLDFSIGALEAVVEMFPHLARIKCLIRHPIVLELSVLLSDVVIAKISELVGFSLGDQCKSERILFPLLWITKWLNLLTKALVERLVFLVLLRG